MNEQTTFSALVTGLPPGVHGPDLRHGESRLQFLIRHHPDEWKNFGERVGKDLGFEESDHKRLIAQDPALINRSQIVPHITRWANMRLPAHWRTLHCLSELRSSLTQAPMSLFGLSLKQIIWPREKNPSCDDSAERIAAEIGAEVVSLSTGIVRELDFRQFTPMIKAEYLWIVPGGSSFMCAMTEMSLHRIFTAMRACPTAALYSDGAYSMIYRTSALQSAAEHVPGAILTHAFLCSIWERMCFSCIGDRDPEHPLCEIEKIYGGTYPFPKPPGLTSWFGRLFGA